MSSRQERIDSNRAIWQGATWDDVATFIGPNAESYRDAFEETRQKVMDRGYGIARGWSWPALIFGFAFFLYRKHWAIGAALLVAPIALNYFIEVPSAWVGVAIVMAMHAKSFIVQQAVSRVAKIRAVGGDDTNISTAGGVSLAGGIVGGGLWLFGLVSAILAISNIASA